MTYLIEQVILRLLREINELSGVTSTNLIRVQFITINNVEIALTTWTSCEIMENILAQKNMFESWGTEVTKQGKQKYPSALEKKESKVSGR